MKSRKGLTLLCPRSLLAQWTRHVLTTRPRNKPDDTSMNDLFFLLWWNKPPDIEKVCRPMLTRQRLYEMIYYSILSTGLQLLKSLFSHFIFGNPVFPKHFAIRRLSLSISVNAALCKGARPWAETPGPALQVRLFRG